MLSRSLEIEAASGAKNEYRDCVVRATTVATGLDYDTVHAKFAELGRKPRRGTPMVLCFAALDELDFTHKEVTGHFESKTIVTIEKEMRRKFRGMKFMVLVSGHLAGFDGERMVDWTRGRRHRVQRVYHVVSRGGEVLQELKKLNDAAAPQSEYRDIIFYYPVKGQWRIYRRENGKVRWVNTKDNEWAAERAVDNAVWRLGTGRWTNAGKLDPKAVPQD